MDTNGQIPHKNGDIKGVLGDGEAHAGKYNMALVRRAIKQGWPISEHTRELVVAQMELIVEEGESARDQVAAAKVLVAADLVNARREATAEKPAGGVVINNNTQVNVHSNLDDLIQAELSRLAANREAGLLPETAGPEPGG